VDRGVYEGVGEVGAEAVLVGAAGGPEEAGVALAFVGRENEVDQSMAVTMAVTVTVTVTVVVVVLVVVVKVMTLILAMTLTEAPAQPRTPPRPPGRASPPSGAPGWRRQKQPQQR
jgi:hypothetical protein